MTDERLVDFICPSCGSLEFKSREIIEIERTNLVKFASRGGIEQYGEIVNATPVETWTCAGCGYKLTDEEMWAFEEATEGLDWRSEFSWNK
jgi:hypothetical protein